MSIIQDLMAGIDRSDYRGSQYLVFKSQMMFENNSEDFTTD